LDHHARLLAVAFATAGAMLFAFAVPASAQTSTGTVDSPNSGVIAIPVTATVASSCQFAGTGPAGTFNVPNVNAGFTDDFDFSVSCSTAFRVGVVSANGALVAPAVTLPAGYAASAPYTVSVDLKGDTLDSGLIACDASTLTASAGSRRPPARAYAWAGRPPGLPTPRSSASQRPLTAARRC
jgi:hypothetical protein